VEWVKLGIHSRRLVLTAGLVHANHNEAQGKQLPGRTTAAETTEFVCQARSLRLQRVLDVTALVPKLRSHWGLGKRRLSIAMGYCARPSSTPELLTSRGFHCFTDKDPVPHIDGSFGVYRDDDRF